MAVEVPVQPTYEAAPPPPEPVDYASRYGGIGVTTDPEGDLPAVDAAVALPPPEVTSTTTTSDFESRYADIGIVPGTERTAAELDPTPSPAPTPLPEFADRYADIGPTPAAQKALDETPSPEPEQVTNPLNEEIRAVSPYEPREILRKIESATDKLFAPGSEHMTPAIVSPEVAKVGVRLFGGGARTAAKLLESMTGKPYQAAEAATEDTLANAVSGFTVPEQIAGLLQFAVPGVADAYAVNVLSKLPDQFGHLKDTIEQHGLVSAETAKAATEAGITDLFGFLSGKSAPHVKFRSGSVIPKTPVEAPEPAPATVTPEVPAPQTETARVASIAAEKVKIESQPPEKNGGEAFVLKRGEETVGAIEADQTKHGLQVFNVNVSPELQRQGHATALYEALIKKRGEIISDSSVSESAAGVYEALARKGYQVTKNPEAFLREDGRWVTPDKNDHVFRVSQPATGGGEILTETAVPQGTADLPENLPRARELPTLRAGEKQGDLLSTQTEDLSLVGEKGIDHGARQTAKEKAAQDAEEARLKQESEQQLLEERYAIESDTGDELLTAVAKAGGLPAKSSKYRKFFVGELDRVDEAVRNPMSKKQTVSPNMIFRKDAPDLDELTTRLRGKGFDFETPNDLLNAVENRMFTDRPHYPKPPQTAGQELFGGPGAQAAIEKVPTNKARAFGERFQDDEAMVQDLRDATGNRFYEPISNKVTMDNATDIVKERGIPESINMLKDEANGLDFRVRSAMGQFIIKRLNEGIRALQKDSPKDAEMLLNQTADLSEWQMEYGTRLGQGVQSFAMWSVMTPEGKLMKLKRDIQKVRDKFTQENGDQVKPIIEGAKDASAEAKGQNGEGKAAVKDEKVNEDKIEKLVTREQDRIARQLSDTPTWKKAEAKKQNEILALIRAHLKKEQDGFVGKMLDFGVEDTLTKSIDRIAAENRRRIEVISKSKERARRAAQFDNAADRIADHLSDTPTFSGGKGQIDPARELIRQHLKKPQPDFIKRLVDYGADKPTAETIDRMAVENRERILKVDRAKRAEDLRRQLTGGNKVARKLAAKEWQKIVELADHGLLNDQAFMDLAGEKLGLPTFTIENRTEVLRLAHEIEAAPEGMPRDKATLELGKYIANLKGFDAKDVPLGIFYGNMLSGYNTQIVNGLDTFLNVGSEINGLAVTNPKAAMKIYGGLLRGFSEGRTDALLALTEGRMVTDGKWLEVPKLMEVAKFGEKGGVPIRVTGTGSRLIKAASESKIAYPLRGWKYVTRLMAASDAIMFRGAKEARMSLLADRLARGEGLHGRALTNRVNEILGLDEKATQSFTEQAKSEGFTGAKAKARIAELREMSRPKEASADAADFAGEATYNHEPHGVLGYFADAAGKASNKYPALKAFVPFTRIVANVTNRGLNYTPVGFKRAFYGYSGEAAPLGDARTAMLARATMGTVAMGTMLALQESGVLEVHGAGPSDNERRKQLQNAGWKPYSIKVGDHYFSYVYTPAGLGLSIIGNMTDSYRYNELSQKDAFTRAGYAISRIGSTVFNQSFLSGLSGLFRALSGSPGDTIASVKQTLSSTFGSFTTPTILRDIYRLFDPQVYQTTNIVGDLLKNTPFAAAVNKPALNAFGESVNYPSNRFISEVKDDAAWRFIVEKGLRVPVPDKYSQVPDGDGGKRRITPDEYYRYLHDSGQQIKAVVLDKRFEWATLDHDEAQKQLSAESERIRDQVKRELFQ